jgi:hypothetical protein
LEFLTPGTILTASALTVPPLVLLYFLKLRRREMLISSTFFWKQAVQDLQVNAPFQKLRRNLLLLLQLLVLLLCAFALGQPLLQRDQTEEKSLILMIDRSASMNVIEPDGKSRLRRAQDEAAKVVEQMQTSDRAMLVAFSGRASVLQSFTGNRNQLLDAIERIRPGEGLSRLQEAVSLAKAHAQMQIVPSRGGGETPILNKRPVQLKVISDGRVEDADVVAVDQMGIELINVGINDDNVGIISLQATRQYERPEMINIVATVENFGPSAVDVDIDLFIAGDHFGVQSVHLGPGIATGDESEDEPASSIAAVAFPPEGREMIAFEGAGVVEVRLSRADALAIDNRSQVILPEPRTLSVLAVTDGNYTLGKTLNALPLRWQQMTLSEYESAREEDLVESGRSVFDVVIFDGCSSPRLPIGNYFFFGSVPQVDGYAMGQTFEFDAIFDWDESHSVMRYVNPLNVDIASWRELQLPDHAESVMDAYSGTVLAAVSHGASRYLICGFGMLSDDRTAVNTTWMARPNWVVFMHNAVQFLSGTLEVDVESRLRPGDTLAIDVPKGTDRVTVTRPDGTTESVLVGNLETAHYGNTEQVGIYRIEPTVDGASEFAVNLFSPQEGVIAPNAEFTVPGTAVETRSSALITNVPVWPLALTAALVLLFLEWVVYSRRVFV